MTSAATELRQGVAEDDLLGNSRHLATDSRRRIPLPIERRGVRRQALGQPDLSEKPHAGFREHRGFVREQKFTAICHGVPEGSEPRGDEISILE